MPNVKTLALRRAAVELLADEFDQSGIPYTSAAIVITLVRDRCPSLTPGTGWTPDRLGLRVADEVHKRRTGVRAVGVHDSRLPVDPAGVSALVDALGAAPANRLIMPRGLRDALERELRR